MIEKIDITLETDIVERRKANYKERGGILLDWWVWSEECPLIPCFELLGQEPHTCLFGSNLVRFADPPGDKTIIACKYLKDEDIPTSKTKQFLVSCGLSMTFKRRSL